MKNYLRTACVVSSLLLSCLSQAQAQTCPAPPGKDVLLFLDNSGSISNDEYAAAQQAIAGIASDVLSRPGYRMAVVNWACTGFDGPNDGCRLDLATGSAIPGGWSSNPADFAYAGDNSAANRVCRSFGYAHLDPSNVFINRSNCGEPNFTTAISGDYAQDALRMLEGALYSGGGTGGVDSVGAPTAGPSSPTQQLMLIHLTDAVALSNSRIREVPGVDSARGDYYYSNRLKSVRNALIVGVGVSDTTTFTLAQQEVAALSSKGGSSAFYDPVHASAPSTQASDAGAPRLATFSPTFDAASILDAARRAFDATVPACVILRKQSVNGTGSFSFTGGTNGLPATLTLNTATTNPQTANGVYLSQFSAPTSITETIAPGWALNSMACVNASNAAVPVTSDLTTGLLTIPAAEVVSGARLTCTFTNTRAPQLRLQKTLPGGRAVATDQFTLNMTGMASLTTTGTGSTATGVLTHSGAVPGTPYTLSESAAGATNLAAYTTAYSCTNALPGGQAPSGAGRSFSLTPVAGDDLTCTFTNTAVPVADLGILKTGSAASARTGDVVSFTLTASNNGPGTANGAVIRDVPGPGLDCSTPSPTASCSASGGAACPGATVPVADLLGPAGVVIPVLPAGGSVVLALQCRVTATGLP